MIDKLKNAWRSRTIWFNAILLAALPVFELALQILPQIQEFVPANVYKIVGVVAVVGNTVLRFLTQHPLEAK